VSPRPASGLEPSGTDELTLGLSLRLELSETNKYSWPDASEADETNFYLKTWALLREKGVAAAIMDALREGHNANFPLFLGGNAPLNYYLEQETYRAIPSSDIDIKVAYFQYFPHLASVTHP
jgi:hypothetical protein